MSSIENERPNKIMRIKKKKTERNRVRVRARERKRESERDFNSPSQNFLLGIQVLKQMRLILRIRYFYFVNLLMTIINFKNDLNFLSQYRIIVKKQNHSKRLIKKHSCLFLSYFPEATGFKLFVFIFAIQFVFPFSPLSKIVVNHNFWFTLFFKVLLL